MAEHIPASPPHAAETPSPSPRSGRAPAALEPRRFYTAIADAQAAAEGLIRVVDESGEDDLYPRRFFRTVTLDDSTRRALRFTRRSR